MQSEWLESIQKIWDVQERVQHVHPFLSKTFPNDKPHLLTDIDGLFTEMFNV